MVDGPSSPDFMLFLKTSSMIESRISGADEPSAIRVRLATVSFHTFSRKWRLVPSITLVTV